MNIWVAASDGQLDVVKNFIENDGLSPNAKDENGYTPCTQQPRTATWICSGT